MNFMLRSQAHPHASALRKGRVSESGRIYSVTTVTHERECVFEDFRASRLLVSTLRWLNENSRIASIAYMIMPDHLHWIFTLNEPFTLSAIMHSLKTHSAIEINRYLCTSGRLWQPGFHDHALRTEADLSTMIRYIVTNPVRARLVNDICDYSHWDISGLEPFMGW
ncbi:MAG TPA: transposase [Gammaproteobacteria bacterium]|nr:transposase [Gammaproteobacteria bacterium]